MSKKDDTWSTSHDSDVAFSTYVVDMAVGTWDDPQFSGLVTTCWPTRVIAAASLKKNEATSEYTWSRNASSLTSEERTTESNQYSVTISCFRRLPNEFAVRLFDALVAITRRVAPQDDAFSPWVTVELSDLTPLLQVDYCGAYLSEEIEAQLVQLAALMIETADENCKLVYNVFDAEYSSAEDGTLFDIRLRWAQAIYDAVSGSK